MCIYNHYKTGMYLNSLGECKLKQMIFNLEHPEPAASSPAHSRLTPRQYIVSLSSEASSSPSQQQLQQRAKKEEDERHARREIDENLRHALEVTERALGFDHIEVAGIFFYKKNFL